MQRSFKTKAFVLRKRNLPNKDNIITLFSEKFGKINTIAKGVKKITSRRLPHLLTGNLISSIIYKRFDYLYLQETSLISGFTGIKGSQEKMNYLYFLFFVIERLLPENQPEKEIYSIVREFVINLSKTAFSTSKLEDYISKILISLGYLKEKKQSINQLIFIIESIIDEKTPAFTI